MFIRNAWYVAAQSANVRRAPLAVRVLGEPVVLYRTQTGTAVALEDRCPHRNAPLSLGELAGDVVRCRYHGFEFGPNGACLRIPGERIIPPTIRVRQYPAVEQYGMVWIWTGDSAAADVAKIPPYEWLGAEGFVSDCVELTVDAPFLMIVDNLMDLTHVYFTHKLLGVGNPVHESEPMQTKMLGEEVAWTRDLPAKDGVGIQFGGHYYPPSVVTTFGVPIDAVTGMRQPGYAAQVLHCLTPQDAHATRYIALKCWNVKTRPDEVLAMRQQNEFTLREDKEIVEAVCRSKAQGAEPPIEHLIRADRAAVLARRSYEALLKRETNASAMTLTGVARGE